MRKAMAGVALGLTCALAAACSHGTRHAAVQSPSASRSASPTASATRASAPVHKPAPPPVFPLTGEPTKGSRLAARPALSVKIDNAPDALPQPGLDEADLVTEELVEGGLTRLLVTYQSHDSTLIGPVRSIRPVDALLARQLGRSILAYSGGAQGEIAPSVAYSNALLLSNDALSGDPANPFYRVGWRFAPHNVYTTTARLYGYASSHSHDRTTPPRLFTYGALPAGARVVPRVTIPMSAAMASTWTWNAPLGWVRAQNGRADTLGDGRPVTTANVVILSTVATPIPGLTDSAGNHDQDIHLVGSGSCWVLRDGRVIVGHWVRPSMDAPVRLLDAHGKVIPLHTGRTWLELEPTPYQPQLG